MLCPSRVFVMCVFRLPYLEIHCKDNVNLSIRKIFAAKKVFSGLKLLEVASAV